MVDFPGESLFPTWRGRTAWKDRARDLAQTLSANNPGLDAAIQSHPFERFEAIQAAAPAANYTRVPAPLAAFVDEMPAELHTPYLCALLIWHMEHFDERFPATGLHPEFALHYADAFNRVLDQIAAKPEFAVLAKDAFLKDLWIARLVIIPAFAQIWWPRSGLSKKQLLRAGPGALAHAYLRCGGTQPFFEGHTHDPMARAYWNANGWAEALRLIALAMPAFPRHKGVFGTAWFYDPAMETVSPRITFPMDLQIGKGGYRFKVSSNESAIANATAASPTRRRMFAEGSYIPTDYAVVWARRDLIRAYGP